ncbi:hypothetical protein CY34DRAFT_799381 [Suillus luteus UH-Slu-Lm8-n1]|uniref:Unplaced genomic scaffold CY34scaffold_16, whole genome shotgun sequence n=1 Tax=Suillus luteus UH-Slu-Lm8-n1 TaxID=930992 RepID=A0A0D0BNV7_9AGAM|nr:hypothetical protein CY34DRAFT_799381 [Suillus luteus UH-Slu-Lm8-n1]
MSQWYHSHQLYFGEQNFLLIPTFELALQIHVETHTYVACSSSQMKLFQRVNVS